MPLPFDPYHRWLGIPFQEQPPDHYRLLGLTRFENDPEVIRDAAERQIAHVRRYQIGPHAQLSQKLLNELSAAKACLTDPAKRAIYDRSLPSALGSSQPPQAPSIEPSGVRARNDPSASDAHGRLAPLPPSLRERRSLPAVLSLAAGLALIALSIAFALRMTAPQSPTPETIAAAPPTIPKTPSVEQPPRPMADPGTEPPTTSNLPQSPPVPATVVANERISVAPAPDPVPKAEKPTEKMPADEPATRPKDAPSPNTTAQDSPAVSPVPPMAVPVPSNSLTPPAQQQPDEPSSPLRSPVYTKPLPIVGQAPLRLQGHTGPVNSLDFNPLGTLASAGEDGTVRLWDLKNRRELSRMGNARGPVRCLRFVDAGAGLLACGGHAFSRDGGSWLILWNGHTGEELIRIPGHPLGSYRAMVVAPTQWHVYAAGVADAGVTLVDLRARKTMRDHVGQVAAPHDATNVGGPGFTVSSLAVASDEQTGYFGVRDGTIRVWGLGLARETRRFNGDHSEVTALALSPGDAFVLSGDLEGTVRLWDAATGQPIRTLSGHTRTITGMVFSPDSRMALTASRDATVRLWDVATGTQLAQFDGHPGGATSIAWDPGRRLLAVGAQDGSIFVWTTPALTTRVASTPRPAAPEMTTYDEVRPPQPRGTEPSDVTKLTLRNGMHKRAEAYHAGKQRYVTTEKNQVVVYEGRARKELIRFAVEKTPVRLAISPCGTKLAAAVTSQIYCWDLQTTRRLRRIGNQPPVGLMEWHPNGKWLAFCTGGSVRVTDTHDAHDRIVILPSAEAGWVEDIAFSPDGTLLAAIHTSGTAAVWNLTKAKLVQQKSQAANQIIEDSLRFALNGAMLLADQTNGQTVTLLP